MSRAIIEMSADQLLAALREIQQQATALERHYHQDIAAADPTYRPSARNLLHYVSLRRHDLRDLQQSLSCLGLSSLGRLESYTMAGVDAVREALHRLTARPRDPGEACDPPADFAEGQRLLEDHTNALLGPPRRERSVRIMVTMPSEAATDPSLVHDLIAAGMDVMRINCAHDDAAAWEAMVRNLRAAEAALGARCRVYADLCGPKLRTGPIASDVRIVKLRPRRDVMGIVVEPGRAWLTPAVPQDSPSESNASVVSGAPNRSGAVIPVDSAILTPSQVGDVIALRDTRGRARQLRIVASEGDARFVETNRTTYFADGAELRLIHEGRTVARGVICGLPAVEIPIELKKGDTLVLTRDLSPGQHAVIDDDGAVLQPARIGCSLGDAFDDIRVGHRIFFDDGKIGGVIQEHAGDHLVIQINHAPAAGSKLRSDKGINLPDSDLRLPALTPQDLTDLDAVVRFADIIGLSFVHRPEDVYLLEHEMAVRGGAHLGVVLKIETRQGFENLPRILLASLRSPPVGVMVARGDLAVEVGFERLAEVQEEILWLCEAAHVPVIWATQVLESLAKTGSPSRAEVTDAAMGVRAECVMLNKGPFITDAVRFLSGVLERMQAHQHKKRTMLRKLSVSQMKEMDAAEK